MADIPKPITREDMYYKYLINNDGTLPKPITRKEMYLYYLCTNGFGGGGTVTPEMIDAAVNAALKLAKDYTDNVVSNAGYSLGLNIDSDYIMTMELKNADGIVVSAKSVDFPIESMVVGASYADGIVTLSLQNGDEIGVDVSDLVNGLVNDNFTIAGINMKDAITAEELRTALNVPAAVKVKGNAETTYRTGNVNLTPQNIGAVAETKVLTSKDQINANTDAANVAGATAVKGMIDELSSNLNNYKRIMSRMYNTSWGTSLIVPPLAHGIIIISQHSLYIVWIAGNANAFEVNHESIYGANDATFTCKKENGELTVTIPYTAGITYIGK